jgi:hypothetical protein
MQVHLATGGADHQQAVLSLFADSSGTGVRQAGRFEGGADLRNPAQRDENIHVGVAARRVV